MMPDLTISTLLASYRDKSTTPREVIQGAWQRAEEGDARIWISRPRWSEVEDLLAALEQKDPGSLPLYGIPFAIKDNIDWAGHPTTAACPAFSYVPEKSAFVVEKLIAAGAVPIGKTNLDQFATGLVGVRSPYGTPANPFDAKYIPGGSSSGSAVAVALGMASFSLGTDTAGSGRVPASFNNLVGVKPTRGWLSCSGLVPACRTLDCVSIFALSAADAWRVLEVTAVFDDADAYARPAAPSRRAHDGASPTIGVPKSNHLQFFGNEAARQLFAEAVEEMKKAGWRIREVDVQPFLDAARLLYEGPWLAERYAVAGPLLEKNPEALHPVTRQIIESGAKLNAVAAFEAQYRLAELKRASEAVWQEVDAIVTPTAGTIYTVAEVEADPLRLNSNLGHYTNFMNLLDLAAWAVPAGFLPGKLPWGITFFAPAFEDRFLGALASRFHAGLKLPLGMTSRRSDEVETIEEAPNKDAGRWIKIGVCGAHMEGLGLNHQLTSRGGRKVCTAQTAAKYRLYLLPGSGPVPDRPGMVKVAEQGVSLDMEIWELPEHTVGSFVDAVPAPLGFGRVELVDGRSVCGFLCEPVALKPEFEITQYGGWRTWLAREK